MAIFTQTLTFIDDMTDPELKKLVVGGILEFESQSNQLVLDLASHLGIEFKSVSPWNQVSKGIRHEKNGKFNEWKFNFHGDSCKFTNENSGQILDVKMFGEFAYSSFGTFYLLEYFKSSESLPSQIRKIRTESELKIICDELISEGILIKLLEPPFYVLKRIENEC